MPIIVKDFTWRQTESTVTIFVPLKNTHPSKVDVFTSARYLKLCYVPYFFDVVLYAPVDVAKSTCTFTKENSVFELTKIEPQTWETLESELPRTEKNELKRQYVEQEFQKLQKDIENRSIKRHELKRVAVREQISMETKQRQLVEKLKSEEKTEALGNFVEWKDQMKAIENSSDIREISSDTDSTLSDSDVDDKLQEPSSEPTSSNAPCYPIRTSAVVKVDFTERILPTPCRESRMEEENEWLRKQAEARRSVGFDKDDLRPEEKNPQYLLWKGDEFCKQGNYKGAISAYSFGIKLSPNFVDLYIARARVHFNIENVCKCAEDCSSAIDLMKPECPANLEQRVECIFKRGICLFKLGHKEKGTNEIRAALRLQPNNETMKNKLEELMDIWADED